MTNTSTVNTARLARQWAEETDPAPLDEKSRAAREHVLATTEPLTMADVEWDGDEHWLAGATLPNGVEVVMLRHDNGSSSIDTNQGYYSRGYLTPNGKRYELTEVTGENETKNLDETSEYPDTLVTLEDYTRAPLGTIVDIDGTVAVLKTSGWNLAGHAGNYTTPYMPVYMGEGKVVKWGPGG